MPKKKMDEYRARMARESAEASEKNSHSLATIEAIPVTAKDVIN
jgi:hypothetical protein